MSHLKSSFLMKTFALLPIVVAVAVTACSSTVFAVDKAVQDAIQVIDLLPPGPDNPRNSEGDFIKLKDGRILFVYSHFTGKSGSDHANAYLAGRFSSDGGKTWTDEDALVLANEGGLNVMSVSLLRLQDGRIALFYCRKKSLTDCRPVMRISTDEAKTWNEPINIIPDEDVSYYVLNNDRVIQLKSGRLIVPVALHQHRKEGGKLNHDWAGVIQCYYSDDLGKTWRRSKSSLLTKDANGKRITTQEPGVVELADGRVMIFARTGSGSQYVGYSSDGGDTFTDLEPSTMLSPCAPATIERIPGTNTLFLAWNNHEKIAPELRGKRTPLSVAISTDEGKTWQKAKNLADDPNGWYCYIAMHFEGDHVLLGHCAGDRRTGGLNETHITRIPLELLTK